MFSDENDEKVSPPAWDRIDSLNARLRREFEQGDCTKLVQCSKCCRYVKLADRAIKGRGRYRSWCKACDSAIRHGKTPESVLTPPTNHEFLDELNLGLAANPYDNTQPVDYEYFRRPLVMTPAPARERRPVGQAEGWYLDVVRHVPAPTAKDVAWVLAILCGEDSETTIKRDSLAAMVGRYNSSGHLNSYTDTGIRVLVDHGWLEKELRPRKPTVYRLCVGNIV